MNTTNNEQLKAAYALNMCMVSLSQIVDYNDINILKQEYDAILNNLNIENIIKDEAMLEALKKILDTCHFYILHEKDKELLKKKQAARMKSALTNALANGGRVIAIFSNPNPWSIAATAGIMLGAAAISYKSEKNKALMENEAEAWELEKSALEQLHNLRRTLFETAWRLSDHYKFPDELRLTEKQITIYNNAVADPDPQSRYIRLDLLRDKFQAYPLFWYYLARAALETSELYRKLGPDEKERRINPRKPNSGIYNYYRNEAKTALDEFVAKHSEVQLLREDIIAASAYIDSSLFYEDNPEEMKRRIDYAREIAGFDLEIIQTCSFRYCQLIKMFADKGQTEQAMECRQSAEYCLKLLLHEDYNADLNGMALSQIYKESNAKDAKLKYDLLKDCIGQKTPFVYNNLLPWDEDCYRQDLKEYLDGNQLFNSIGQYFEGRIRCLLIDLYQAIYKSSNLDDNTPLAELKGSVEAEDWKSDICGKIIMQDVDSISPDIQKIRKLLCCSQKAEDAINAYLEQIKVFLESASTTERRGKSLWMKSYLVNFERSELDKWQEKLNKALYKAVSELAVGVTNQLRDQAPGEKEEYILDLASFITAETLRMKAIIQDFTIGKFKYHNYTPPKGIFTL